MKARCVANDERENACYPRTIEDERPGEEGRREEGGASALPRTHPIRMLVIVLIYLIPREPATRSVSRLLADIAFSSTQEAAALEWMQFALTAATGRFFSETRSPEDRAPVSPSSVVDGGSILH